MQSQSAKPKTPKQQPGKIAMAFGYLVVFGAIALVIWGIVDAFSAVTRHKTTAAPTTKAATQKTTVAKPQVTTVSLVSLNAQVAPILTANTNTYDQLYQSLVSASGASDAANSSSTFHQLWDDTEHTVKYDTYTDSYNKASNLYFNGHQGQPAAVDSWQTDIQQVWADIQNYADDEHHVLGDQVTGSSAASDQAKVNADMSAYKSDLAKAKADISQL